MKVMGTCALSAFIFIFTSTVPGVMLLQPNENVETEVQNLKSLYIAAVFPMKGHGGWLGGQGCLPAALMALEDVNKRSDLLIGYKLEIDWRDSQVRIVQLASKYFPGRNPELRATFGIFS